MSTLNEKQINEHIRNAASAITPDKAEEIWETPTERSDDDVWFLSNANHGSNKRKTVKSILKWAGIAAACFAIVIVSWLQLYQHTDSTIYLDVNPSIFINVNRFGRVIEVSAKNEDGRIVLEDMDLRYTDIDVAMNAILGSMVKHGYLSQTDNALLISVKGSNTARVNDLRHRVSGDAEQTLNTVFGSVIILDQSVELDDIIEEIADTYGITPGKVVLILRLFYNQPSLDIGQLAGMPMSELIRYCQIEGIDIPLRLGDKGEMIGDLDSLLDEGFLDVAQEGN